MKAAVLEQLGTIPKYGKLPAPIPENEQQLLIEVKASSIKQLDKLIASGKHYTTYPSFPTTVGFDGAGVLEDGRRVYSVGITGMIAQKALIRKDNWVLLPDNIDFETAAALPNMLMGSDMALLYRAKIKKGDVVLINGATGVTGKVAVQMAKYRGASKVIVTGRNPQSLQKLKELGADETVSLMLDEDEIIKKLTAIQNASPIDIVLDYTWGRPVELILSMLAKMKPHAVRIVTIGQMAGAEIQLTSNILRSNQIELLGSGIGSIQQEESEKYMKEIMPAVFQLVAEGKLKIDIEIVDLVDIEKAWQMKTDAGVRLVVKI